MIIVWANDGQPCEKRRIEELGFSINPARDLRSGRPGEISVWGGGLCRGKRFRPGAFGSGGYRGIAGSGERFL